MNAKGKKKRVRNSGEGGAVDERCGATRGEEKEDRKGRDQRGKKERRNRERERERERESEGHGGSERRIKKVNGERGT